MATLPRPSNLRSTKHSPWHTAAAVVAGLALTGGITAADADPEPRPLASSHRS